MRTVEQKASEEIKPHADQLDTVDGLVFARLQFPHLNIETLAEAVSAKASTLGRTGFIYFDGDKWSGWRINGCAQRVSGNVVLGYYMNSNLAQVHDFPEAEALLRMIPGVKHAVRLFKLSPGASVGLHRDQGEFYMNRKWWQVRKVHIPLITNDGCRHLYEGTDGQIGSVTMKIGEAWYLNGTRLHGAENKGNCDRWHLVVDVDPTTNLYSLITSDR
jgi:hypothetical protein